METVEKMFNIESVSYHKNLISMNESLVTQSYNLLSNINKVLKIGLMLTLIFLCPFNNIYSQGLKKEITGRVIDEKGEYIIGASVIEINSTPINGTTTDLYGNYVISVSSSNSVLKFSFVGYEDQEIRVGADNVLDVTLREKTSVLDEVTVVAFGVQKKTDLIGSVTSIKPSELKGPTSNITQMLAGQAAGVISYQQTGEPGEDNANFFVRGITSFGVGKVDPLILIDGMELSVTELARLRPDDIESFSIFKDATSTALYGARGANGVIYVTTKQGKEGRPVVAFRAESSISQPTKNVEFADPVTYMKLYNDAQYSRDPFSVPFYSQEKIDYTQSGLYPNIFPAVDWRSELFKNSAFNHRYDLSVSGGGKVASYFVSGSYSQDNGILKVNKMNNFNNNISLKSYTLRANVNINLTPSTEMIVRLNGNFDDYTGPIEGGGSIYEKMVRTSPVDFPAYYPVNEESKYIHHIMFGGLRDRSYENPYAEMVRGYKEYSRSLMMAQLEFKQNLSFITEGLNFRAMFNTNRLSRFDMIRSYNPFFYDLVAYDRKTGEYAISRINETTGTEFLDFDLDEDERKQESIIYFESALSYSKEIAEKHAVNAMLVYILRSQQNANASSLQLSLPARNMGISGRTTYSYDERYFAEFNFGYNGSERFHRDKRFGFFPSFGLAWLISNESFWLPLKETINMFKLRATYGYVGNDQIGANNDRFFYLSNVNMNSNNKYTFGRETNYTRPGVEVTQYANPAVTWEVSEKVNLALELGLFSEWNIQFDAFKERRRNILMSRADIPSTMGLTAPVRANIGEASSNGFEVSTDFSHHFTNDFWMQVRGNFTYATNKYEVYEEPEYEKEWWKSRIGYPIQQPYGYIAERLFVDDEEVANSPRQQFGNAVNIAGDIKYRDINGDGEITPLDQVPIGFPLTPEIIYGSGISTGYKGLDFSVFFQGSARSSFWMGGRVQSTTGPVNVEPFVGGKQILAAFADSHYSLDNPDLYALWPRLSTTAQQNNTQLSTWWLNDGRFLRLKRAEIGYSLPTRIAQKAHLQTLRIYASGSNLLLWSKFKLWDVEMGGNGLGYPLQRVFNLGVNLTF